MPATDIKVDLLTMTPDAEALGVEILEMLPTRPDISGHHRRWAKMKCKACGKEFEALSQNAKKLKSCGCISGKLKGIAQIKHGLARTRLYHEWIDIKSRCLNQNNPRYHRYGGRGITITPEWMDFLTFARWAIGAGYNDSLTIDRINNDSGYCPDNCRWVTLEENIQNRPRAKMIPKACPQCQEVFEVKNGNRHRIFCSNTCRIQATVGRPKGDYWWKQNCA